jgi:hypothetical protein
MGRGGEARGKGDEMRRVINKERCIADAPYG